MGNGEHQRRHPARVCDVGLGAGGQQLLHDTGLSLLARNHERTLTMAIHGVGAGSAPPHERPHGLGAARADRRDQLRVGPGGPRPRGLHLLARLEAGQRLPQPRCEQCQHIFRQPQAEPPVLIDHPGLARALPRPAEVLPRRGVQIGIH